jgi:hypothetical protein
MRCYHFCNFYLSSIQQGIQSSHAQMELFNKYVPNVSNNDMVNSETFDILFDWSLNYKTMIVLNGGDSKSLGDICYFLNTSNNPYPWSYFQESNEALGGIITNIAVVLPEKIYETASEIRGKGDEINWSQLQMQYGKFSQFERNLCTYLNKFGLAR